MTRGTGPQKGRGWRQRGAQSRRCKGAEVLHVLTVGFGVLYKVRPAMRVSNRGESTYKGRGLTCLSCSWISCRVMSSVGTAAMVDDVHKG